MYTGKGILCDLFILGMWHSEVLNVNYQDLLYKDNDTFFYTIGQEVKIPGGQKEDRTCQSDKKEIINGHLTYA